MGFSDYPVSNKVLEEPLFAWWATYIINKGNVLVSKVKSQHHKLTDNYGLEMPIALAHAHHMDKENGNTLWMDVYNKDAKKNYIAFKAIQPGERAPLG